MYSKKQCAQLKLGNTLKQLNIRSTAIKFTQEVTILLLNKTVKLIISKISKECNMILRKTTIRKKPGKIFQQNNDCCILYFLIEKDSKFCLNSPPKNGRSDG